MTTYTTQAEVQAIATSTINGQKNVNGGVVSLNAITGKIDPSLVSIPNEEELVYRDELVVGYATKVEIEGVQKAESINLFNKANVILEVFVNWTNGALSSNVDHMSSDYIPVIVGQSYFRSGNNQAPTATRVAWYDSSKVFLSGIETPVFPVTAPAGVSYMRISTGKLNLDTFKVEKGISATAYTPYALQFINPSLKIFPEQTFGIRLNSEKVPNTALDMLLPPINLFDKSKITPGFFISWLNGSATSNSSYFASDWIEVSSSTYYMLSGNISPVTTHMAWYTDTKQFISGFQSPEYPIQSPANAAFARFSAGNANIDTLMISKGESALPYSKYGFRISESVILPENNQVTPPTKVWTAKGDSITDQNRWQTTVLDALGNLTYNKRGVSGSRLSGASVDAMWQDVRVNDIPTNTDYLTLLCGTNDWAQSAPIGTDSSTNTAEFKGAFNVWLPKIIARCPNALIIIMTTPVGKRLDISGHPSWADNFTNNLGLTSSDYAQALRDMAKKWNLPIIDTNALGWNEINIETYCPDGFHPYLIGADRIANRVIQDFKYLAR